MCRALSPHGTPPLRATLHLLGLLAGLTACQGVPMSPEALRGAAAQGRLDARGARRVVPADPAEQTRLDRLRREHFVRSRLLDARRFRRQGNDAMAARALHDVLELDPEHVRALRLLAAVREAEGRTADAAALRARADAVSPRPPAPPDTPLLRDARGLLVVLLPSGEPERGPPRAELESRLAARVSTRLPGARIERAPADSVPAIRAHLRDAGAAATLTLRIERAFCADTVKDGAFALVELRVAAATAAAETADAFPVREVIEDPRAPAPGSTHGCIDEALARALEAALASDAPRGALAALVPPPTSGVGAAPGAPARWPSPVVRVLFPHLTRLIERELRLGRDQLATGRIAEAAASFQRAAAIDPDDKDVRAYLAEAEQTLQLLAQLSRADATPDGDDAAGAGMLDPQLTSEQRAALEQRLADESDRRAELLARIALTRADVTLPPLEALAALRPVKLPAEDAAGPKLARARAEGPIEARALYAGDGRVVARFYFRIGDALPVLREEDQNGDGRADFWVGYRAGSRHEMWEDGHGTGRPDIHWVFASGGVEVDHIEIDADADGRVERLLRYASGQLSVEERDTTGDGRIDLRETFDRRGEVELREEDLDGDGQFDLRSRFHRGRLVSREIHDPRFVGPHL